MAKAIDLTGQRFGMLIVERKTKKRDVRGSCVWECKCDCGNTCEASVSTLRSGHKKSCWCKAKHDLSGRRFGLLYVVEKAPNKGDKTAWRCLCDCGSETVTTTNYLLSGTTRSCGCLRVKHNGVGTRIYGIWRGIRNRCNNSNLAGWKYYGGKGISVCEEWLGDFDSFRSWAYSNGYRKGLQIDRIDSSGDYCPENCRFVTPKVNVRNRASVKLNEEKVSEIKAMILAGDDPNGIASMYGINRTTLADIENNRTWCDVK